jgi:hypothetical protein
MEYPGCQDLMDIPGLEQLEKPLIFYGNPNINPNP